MDFNKYKGNSPAVHEEFRQDAMKELGIEGHDKADWMWSLAWKHGHLYGFKEVFFQLRDLTKMLVRDGNESNRRFN